MLLTLVYKLLFLQLIRAYGYEAWLAEDTKYKLKLISSLPEEYISKCNNLVVYSSGNADIDRNLMFILSKRLYTLLNLPSNYIREYTCTELKKIHTLTSVLPLNQVMCTLTLVPLRTITQLNVVNLYKFVSNYDNFRDGLVPIAWGPGNNKDSLINAIKHYEKHTLYNQNKEYDDEYLKWRYILSNNDLYIEYPVKYFYKMKDVMVHTNGKGVYLSGFYHNVFIVGRYEGDTFGISSCYYVKSRRKPGREINRVFDINFCCSD